MTQILDQIVVSGTHMAAYLVLGLSFLTVFRSSGLLNFTHGYLGITAVYLFKLICDRISAIPSWTALLLTATAMAVLAVAFKALIDVLRTSRLGVLRDDTVLFGTIGLAFLIEGVLSYLSSGESSKVSRLQMDPVTTAAGIGVAATVGAAACIAILRFSGGYRAHSALRRDGRRSTLWTVACLAVLWVLGAIGVSLLLGTALEKALVLTSGSNLTLKYSATQLAVVPAAILFVLITRRFERTEIGLVIRACRSNPELGHSLGFSVRSAELLAFVYSVAMVSLGGVVIALAFDTVRISDAFRWTLFGFSCGLLTASIVGAVGAAAILALTKGAAGWLFGNQALGEPAGLIVLALMLLAAGLRHQISACWDGILGWLLARQDLQARKAPS
jgi:branched-subunit amino acid ABC-type transport system permease component